MQPGAAQFAGMGFGSMAAGPYLPRKVAYKKLWRSFWISNLIYAAPYYLIAMGEMWPQLNSTIRYSGDEILNWIQVRLILTVGFLRPLGCFLKGAYYRSIKTCESKYVYSHGIVPAAWLFSVFECWSPLIFFHSNLDRGRFTVTWLLWSRIQLFLTLVFNGTEVESPRP